MIRKINHEAMGKSDLGWLHSHFHFSFAEYYNPQNISFGALRVINDDLVAPHTGFGPHPHENMEIVSYILEGELSHADSMDNKRVLKRGGVQYLSAGTGIWHSEENLADDTLRFLQIWVVPDKRGHKPNYGDFSFPLELREGKWFHFVSDKEGLAPITVNQDINFYARILKKGEVADFEVASDRQVYLVQAEGEGRVNGEVLKTRDALESVEENLHFEALTDTCHYVLIEMKKA